MPTPSPYLTAAEAADLLRTSPINVVRLCRDGRLPATKPAGKWLILRADLDAHLNATHNRNNQKAAS